MPPDPLLVDSARDPALTNLVTKSVIGSLKNLQILPFRVKPVGLEKKGDFH